MSTKILAKIFDGHDKSFREHNEFAHPATPPRLSAPALNWHFAEWRKDGDDSTHTLVTKILNDRLKFEVVNINGQDITKCKDFTLDTLKYTRPGEEWISTDQKKHTNPFTLGRLNCSFMWRKKQLIKLAIEIHTEFVAVTFWMPAYMANVPGGGPSQWCSQELHGKLTPGIRQPLSELMFLMGGGISEKCDLNSREILTRRIRENLGVTLPDELILSTKREKGFIKKLFQGYANDLYGQIWQNLADDLAEPDKKQFTPFAELRTIILPSELPFCPRDIRPGAAPETKLSLSDNFDSPDALTVMRRIDQFLDAEADSVRAELTGSTFLNGRVIYGSSLGTPVHDKSHKDYHRSARFVLISKPSSRWQLGRLVERLNALGTYRLASLRYLEQINGASLMMRDLGADIVSFEGDAIEEPELYDRKMREFYRRFGLTSQGMDNGLNYRIDRSRYYVDTFKRILPDLRIGRIEGFQPYNDFIIRRYGGIWDRISRVGERYSRLAQRLDFLTGRLKSLEQRKQTEKMVSQAESLNEQSRQLREQTAEMVSQTKALNRQAASQTRLLHAAHNVELVILAYYIAQLSKGPVSKTGLYFGEYNYVTALLITPFLALLLKPHFLIEKHEGEAGNAIKSASQPPSTADSAHTAPVATEEVVRTRTTESAPPEQLDFDRMAVFWLFFWLVAAIALYFENRPNNGVVAQQPSKLESVGQVAQPKDGEPVKR